MASAATFEATTNGINIGLAFTVTNLVVSGSAIIVSGPTNTFFLSPIGKVDDNLSDKELLSIALNGLKKLKETSKANASSEALYESEIGTTHFGCADIITEEKGRRIRVILFSVVLRGTVYQGTFLGADPAVKFTNLITRLDTIPSLRIQDAEKPSQKKRKAF